MSLSDTILYTPGRVADLFPGVYGFGEGHDPDELADVSKAVDTVGRSTMVIRMAYKRECMGLTDDDIAFAEGLVPDTVRDMIEQAFKFMSDLLNGRFRG